MLFNKALLGLLLSLSAAAPAWAAIDVYQFENAQQNERFNQLVDELRCPKCQNQNLADSNAEIAKDLRTKVYQMIQAEKNDEEIVDYMVERYGDFVLYEPRVSAQTFMLWYGPTILLVCGLITVFFIIRSRKKKPLLEKGGQTLDELQQKQLDALLTESKDIKK